MSAASYAAEQVTSFHDCVSKEERKQRLSVLLVNLLIWCVLVILVAATFGVILIFAVVGKALEWLLAEYNVRRLQAYGCTVSDRQFPTVHRAVEEVCERFGLQNHYRVILIPSGELNAFAIPEKLPIISRRNACMHKARKPNEGRTDHSPIRETNGQLIL